MRTSEDALLDLIRSSGLEVEAVWGNDPGPSVDAAWRAVAGFGVEPSASVALEGDLGGVHELWLEHARRGDVIGEDGRFLLTAVVTGSSGVGWVRVRLTDTADVSRLVDDQGRVEFIARSRSGGRICGITAEEYDYWIVTLSL
ncbi:hypothetical protein OHA37_05390 [Streptomyces sp. NBC_00335]|uniref:hypothetical protein n=1 Tax=unclassified Streptomyces TaxID=2593676 RepID=UPI0022589B36|nr:MULTISPECIES: hypothetical protein [unclassified Streptomyces]MCX5403314.1 hypothetical protein [Streptomyces sp. NBC_00086]